MTKNDYLRALEEALGDYGEAARREILDDFREHFEEGAARGLSDVEIIAELGTIDELVEELRRMAADETPKREGGSQAPAVRLPAAPEGPMPDRAAPTLIIDAENSDVDVILRPGKELRWHLEEKEASVSSLLSRMLKTGGKATVSFDAGVETDRLRIESGRGIFYVFLPGEVREVRAALRTGDLEAELLTLARLTSRSRSGDATVENCRFSDLELKSVSGDISLRCCTLDRLQLQTTSGDIDAQNVPGRETQVLSASGDISLQNVTGRLEARCSSGDISVTGHVGGELVLASASGDIEAETASPLQAESASGDVAVSISGTENVKASSVSGDLTCTVSGGSYRAELTTRSGDIVNGTGRAAYRDRRRVSVGEGAAVVELKTVSGDILLQER